MERFIYIITFFMVMDELLTIFGKVELETIKRKLQGKKLEQTEKNYLYRSIRPKLRAAEMIASQKILEQINERRDAKLIESSLAAYGYPLLMIKKKKARKMPLEELIPKILIAYPEARYIEAIPWLIISQEPSPFLLCEIASTFSLRNKIGYLLETAIMIKPMKKYNDLLRHLEKTKEKGFSFLVEGDHEFLMKTSPERVKKWNLLGRFFDEDWNR